MNLLRGEVLYVCMEICCIAESPPCLDPGALRYELDRRGPLNRCDKKHFDASSPARWIVDMMINSKTAF